MGNTHRPYHTSDAKDGLLISINVLEFVTVIINYCAVLHLVTTTSATCENIHSWISLVGYLAFSHQGGIYGFKFPKRFSGDLFLRSHNFTLFETKSILKAQPSESMPFPFALAWLNAIRAVRHSHSLSDPVLR